MNLDLENFFDFFFIFFLLVHLYRAHSPVSRSFPNEHGRSSVTFLRPCLYFGYIEIK